MDVLSSLSSLTGGNDALPNTSGNTGDIKIGGLNVPSDFWSDPVNTSLATVSGGSSSSIVLYGGVAVLLALYILKK